MSGNKVPGKRALESGVFPASKKQKIMSDNDTRLPPVVQCALYVAERLMCDPSVTHTIDVILQGIHAPSSLSCKVDPFDR